MGWQKPREGFEPSPATRSPKKGKPITCSAAITSGAKNQPHKHLLIWFCHFSPLPFLRGVPQNQKDRAGLATCLRRLGCVRLPQFSAESLRLPASLADAACFKSWLSPRRRSSQFRRCGIHDVFPTPPILFRYSAGPSIAGSSLRPSLTRSRGLDSTSMISPCSSTVCKPTDRSGA